MRAAARDIGPLVCPFYPSPEPVTMTGSGRYVLDGPDRLCLSGPLRLRSSIAGHESVLDSPRTDRHEVAAGG